MVTDVNRPLIVGVAGGSGSGKTTVVNGLVRLLGAYRVSVIQHDSYYRDRSDLPPAARQHINYDHPDALDTHALVEDLLQLLRGSVVHVPVYDYQTHTRSQETVPTEPRDVIIVDGILILADEALLQTLDIKVFVDTDPDLRIIRRLERDVARRGRTVGSVIQQYTQSVRPMHLAFVEPSKCFADHIIPGSGDNTAALALLAQDIETRLR
jgi:uridine kinase